MIESTTQTNSEVPILFVADDTKQFCESAKTTRDKRVKIRMTREEECKRKKQDENDDDEEYDDEEDDEDDDDTTKTMTTKTMIYIQNGKCLIN